MRKLSKLLFMFLVLLVFAPSKAVNAETLDEYLNNLVGPQQQYSTKVSPQYLRNNTTEEYVNPQNGELTLTNTDYSLPGRNGLDLEIKRIYKSGISNAYEMNARYSNGVWVDYISGDASTASFYENRYNLGIGVRFSFPTIELRTNSDGSSYKFLHTESGDVYRLQAPTVVNGVNIYPIENHSVKDIEVKEDTSESNGQSDGNSKFVMIEKNGKKTFFSSDGRIIKIVDRYGNSIKFEYSTATYTTDGYTRNRRLISKITDTIGRVVNIDYKEDQNFQVILNPDGSRSQDLQGKFQVIISLPDSTPADLNDNKKIIYDKACFTYSVNTLHSTKERIVRVYDIDGALKFSYGFEQPELGFTFSNGSNYLVKNTYNNLTSIVYGKTNNMKTYEYGTFKKKLSDTGSMEYRKITAVKDLSKTGLDASTNTYSVIEKETTNYSYINEPDGQGTAGYLSNDQNYLNNIYRYTTELTDKRGAKTKYTYNGNQLLLNVEKYGNDHKVVSTNTFDANKLPAKNKKETYNVVNGTVVGSAVTKIENYTYDIYGNLTSFTGEMANRDANDNPIDTEYTVNYTYATDRYHILLSKTWKNDATTTAKLEYDVATNGNITQAREIHTGNNVVTDYLYDSYGNITKKTLHNSDYSGNSYVTNYEYGVDVDGNNLQGAYLTKVYGIVDGIEVTNKYVYDFNTGNKKAELDRKGNRSSYEYDIFSRLTKITFSDLTTKEYIYLDNPYEDKAIIVFDQREIPDIYLYDIFGKLVNHFRGQTLSNNEWNCISVVRIQYDSNSNKIKEFDANGNSIRFEYDSANRLKRKSFWINDTTEDRSMNITYNYSNNIANCPRSFYQITTTDEMNNVKVNHYDKLNRLVMIEIPNGPKLVQNTYDYVGNKITIKDGNNNTQTFVYNDLNKLVTQRDSLNNETQFVYDAGGNLISSKNAKNIITYYDYDTLGRMIRKREPAADGTVATTRYIYDAEGNITKTIAPSNYDSTKDTSALVNTMVGVSYTFDNMNRKVTASDTDGNVLEYVKYDANGNISKVVDGLRYSGSIDASPGKTIIYDNLNRVIQTTNALGNSTYSTYDAVGNLLTLKDARGNTTSYEYNPDRTLKKVTFADTGFAEYTYNKLGQKLTQKDQLGNVTAFAYNNLGQLIKVTDPNSNTVEYQYDANGNVITSKDKKGTYSYFAYDAKNRLTQKKIPLEIDGGGNILYTIENYSYDVLGNLTLKSATGTKESSSKRETAYTYYNNNKVNTITDTSGASVKNYYDKNGNIVKVETLRDTGVLDVVKLEYNAMNRVTKSIALVDEADIYNAASLPNISALRDSDYPGKLKLITGYSYDILGNKTKEISSAAYGYLDSDTANRNKYSTSFSYDILNRLEKITYKANGTDMYKQIYYDVAGNKIKERDEKGSISEFTYDSVNRLKTTKDALGRIYTINYDLAGNKTSEVNAKGDTITYLYDNMNRVITVKDPYNNIISRKVYDANGNITKEIDAKGYLSGADDNARYGTVYTYNLANLVTKVVDPEIASKGDSTKFTAKYEYNQYGQKTKATDALGNATNYQYDTAGRLSKVIDALNIATTFEYDKAGNKISMTNGASKVTKYSYTIAGKLKLMTDADNKTISYKYDLSMNLSNLTDRNGNVALYTYDNRNLLLSKAVAATGDAISYSYDELGNRITMTDATGSSTYGYNANNWLTSIAKDGVTQISYSYDEVGNILTVTDKKAFTTTYTYDKANRMKTTSFSGKTTTYNYDENGNRQSIVYQGGITETFNYDKNNNLLTLANKRADQSLISSYNYTYYDNGLKKTKTDQYGTTTYSYDGDSRLTQVSAPGKVTVYAFDNAGNRISLNETYVSNQASGYTDDISGTEIQYKIKTSQYVYSNTNKLIRNIESMKDGSGVELLQRITSYIFDNNGNELSESVSYVKNSFAGSAVTLGLFDYDTETTTAIDNKIDLITNEYDGFNRLKKVEAMKNGKKSITEYTYNGDDLRVKKSVKKSDNAYVPEVTNYLYDGQHVILETDGNDNVKVRYLRGINYIGRIDSTNKLSYFMYNGHGDVVQTVSEAGVIENQYDYDVFGSATLSIEQYSCAIRYAGEYLDNETALYYLRARYYNSNIGRFISEDSYWGEDANPLSLNLYTYGQNNPIRYIDPTGHTVEMNDYDELAYLANNPDVEAAVARGEFSSGYDHFLQYGQYESSRTLFDGSAYLEANADVKAAFERGEFKSGADHYLQYGRNEENRPLNNYSGGGSSSNSSSDDSEPIVQTDSAPSDIDSSNTDSSNGGDNSGGYTEDITGPGAQIESAPSYPVDHGTSNSSYPANIYTGDFSTEGEKSVIEYIKDKAIEYGGKQALKVLGEASKAKIIPIIVADILWNTPITVKAPDIDNEVEVKVELPSSLNPNDIHFMQSSIKNQTGKYTVLENAEALKNGTLKPTDLPTINVWQDGDGKVWTLDNRRLAAFRLAGLDEIPIQWASQEEIDSQMWKMTTKNGGTSIKLKLGNGESMIVK